MRLTTKRMRDTKSALINRLNEFQTRPVTYVVSEFVRIFPAAAVSEQLTTHQMLAQLAKDAVSRAFESLISE